MDISLCSNGLEVNSQIYLKAYLEGSRKRPNPSGLSQLPGFNVTSTSSVTFPTSTLMLSTHSQFTSSVSSSDNFVSTLKRSKRTTNLSELQYERSNDCSFSEDRLLPVQVDLAALVAHPPAHFGDTTSPDGLGWESTGLCLSSDESHSEVDCELQDKESASSSPPSRSLPDNAKEKDKEKSPNIVDDVYRPLKIRRQTEALGSWSQLQRLLDTDHVLSSPLPPVSLPPFPNSCNTSPHTCVHRSHSRVTSAVNKQSALPPSATATSTAAATATASSQTQPLYSSSSKSQPRKLASSFASSLTKKNGPLTVSGGGAAPRILSSAATATVACASAALSSASSASVGYNYHYAASGFLAVNKGTNISNYNANLQSNNTSTVTSHNFAVSHNDDIATQSAIENFVDMNAEAF